MFKDLFIILNNIFPIIFYKLNFKGINEINDNNKLIINEYNQYYKKNKNYEAYFIRISNLEINEKLNIKIQKIVNKGNFVSINGKFYAIFHNNSMAYYEEIF